MLDKNQSGSGTGNVSSAAPASGNKYGGFGSEDIAKFGYNNEEKFGTGPYDPYTKGQSVDTSKSLSAQKKEETKKQKQGESDDDSDSDLSSIDSIDSDATKKKKKRRLKKKAKAAKAKE